MIADIDVIHEGLHKKETVEIRVSSHGHPVVQICAHPILPRDFPVDFEIQLLCGYFERTKEGIYQYAERWRGGGADEELFSIVIEEAGWFLGLPSADKIQTQAFLDRFYGVFPEGFPLRLT